MHFLLSIILFSKRYLLYSKFKCPISNILNPCLETSSAKTVAVGPKDAKIKSKFTATFNVSFIITSYLSQTLVAGVMILLISNASLKRLFYTPNLVTSPSMINNFFPCHSFINFSNQIILFDLSS